MQRKSDYLRRSSRHTAPYERPDGEEKIKQSMHYRYLFRTNMNCRAQQVRLAPRFARWGLSKLSHAEVKLKVTAGGTCERDHQSHPVEMK
jgi:hypothetical protein